MDKNILIYENNDNIYPSINTLQDNFKKFLENRKNLRKSNNIEIIKPSSYKQSQERMSELREKFVNQALNYLGTPYAKKYRNPDDQLYKSPIFLDCCALVRQAVNDLKEDFGFMLNRWNQAYQFDTLPIKLSFEEMKRGDLIFYSAIYYSDKVYY